jgi:MraZ protein
VAKGGEEADRTRAAREERDMGGSFHGAATITLDAKGRVAIPTRHREALLDGGGSLVLSAHPDGCVLIYPKSAWDPVRARVETFPSFHPQASWWKRLLLGFEDHVTPDASGRILLSPALRMHGRLERDAMMVGQGRYFELWDAGVWAEKLGQALSGGAPLPPGMEDFSL